MSNYPSAREQYAALGVDTEAALETLARTPISLHCWQGDDVGGFEKAGSKLEGGGIQATGNYPGKARTIEELRADLGRRGAPQSCAPCRGSCRWPECRRLRVSSRLFQTRRHHRPASNGGRSASWRGSRGRLRCPRRGRRIVRGQRGSCS